MKQILFISILLLAVIGLQAQSVERKQAITLPISFTVFGNSTDTIKKGGPTNVNDFYTVPVTPFAKSAAFEVKAIRTSGTYTKARFVLQKSFGNGVWENVDSVAFAGTATTNVNRIALKTDIYRPLLRLKAYAYDSTQVVKYQYTILIDK